VNKGAQWPQPGAISQMPHRDQVRLLLDCVCVRYPQVDLGPDTIAAYKADWQQLLREVGTTRFLGGVQRACQASSFFPLVADVARHIPPPPPPSTWVGLSDEDRRRQAAGERSYGVPDVRFLAARLLRRIDSKKRAGDHQGLSEEDLTELQAELDHAIDRQERRAS